jgi:hypothetical protein
MTKFQRFVLGIGCARQALIVLGRTDLECRGSHWSRGIERLWVDVKACPKVARDLRRGVMWLKWAGFVGINKVRMLRGHEKFVYLTPLGRPEAKKAMIDAEYDKVLAELA